MEPAAESDPHSAAARPAPPGMPRPVGSDAPFLFGLCVLGGLYVLLIVLMLLADAAYTTPRNLWEALRSPQVVFATKLSLVSCTVTAILSLWVAVPLGYLLSRYRFPGKGLLDALLDIPIVLPPLVIGLSLLILFNTKFGGSSLEAFLRDRLGLPVTYHVPSVILAQFSVSAAFAVRTMRVTFDQIDPRAEQVALTLGCTRGQAFWRVVVPEARRGILTAGTLAWARALGEFGPLLVFAGLNEFRTEVLSLRVWAELSVGKLESAVAVSLLMIASAVAVLMVVRLFGGGADGAVGVIGSAGSAGRGGRR